MADYLFRAPAADMARWKADAERRGVAFSDWLRDAAAMWELQPYVRSPLVRAPVEAVSVAERLGPDGPEAASTGELSSGESGPGSDPSGPPPVDLREQARTLAAKLKTRVG